MATTYYGKEPALTVSVGLLFCNKQCFCQFSISHRDLHQNPHQNLCIIENPHKVNTKILWKIFEILDLCNYSACPLSKHSKLCQGFFAGFYKRFFVRGTHQRRPVASHALDQHHAGRPIRHPRTKRERFSHSRPTRHANEPSQVGTDAKRRSEGGLVTVEAGQRSFLCELVRNGNLWRSPNRRLR